MHTDAFGHCDARAIARHSIPLHSPLTLAPSPCHLTLAPSPCPLILTALPQERKIKMTATLQNPETEKLDKEKMWDDKNRLEARQAKRRERDHSGPELSAGALV